jgi:Protein of unknown function (DUF4199)
LSYGNRQSQKKTDLSAGITTALQVRKTRFHEKGDWYSMKKTVLTFGLISGALSAAMMLGTLPFVENIGFEKGEILGYTTIVLSALLVYFGVRSYRENVGGGRLTFGRGFAVGILITLISSACYVGTWEVVYYKMMPGFTEKYAAHMVESAKASGASQQKVEETERKAREFKQMYNNPAINVAMTFMEVFPIGLVVTLASAGILRKRVRAPED